MLAVIRVAAIVVFLYLLWRNLKEDYQEEALLRYSWLALLAFFAGGRLAYGLINWGIWNEVWTDWFLVWSRPGMSYELGYVSLLIFSYFYGLKSSWKFWAFLEDITTPFLIFLSLLMADEMIRSRFDFSLVVEMLVLVAVLSASSLVKDRYRSIAWYSSGKKGFVFFFANSLYGFLGLLISLFLVESSVTRIGLLAAWATAAGLCLYILGVGEKLMVKRRR